MKITLKPTRKIIKFIVNGAEIPARIWEGETEKGVACHAYITRIAVGTKEDASEYAADAANEAIQIAEKALGRKRDADPS